MVNCTLLMEKYNKKWSIIGMKGSAKLPEDAKIMAAEFAKSYGIPMNIIIKEINTETRKQRVEKARERIRNSVDQMGKLYGEDKELTEITKALEYDDFHEY